LLDGLIRLAMHGGNIVKFYVITHLSSSLNF